MMRISNTSISLYEAHGSTEISLHLSRHAWITLSKSQESKNLTLIEKKKILKQNLSADQNWDWYGTRETKTSGASGYEDYNLHLALI